MQGLRHDPHPLTRLLKVSFKKQWPQFNPAQFFLEFFLLLIITLSISAIFSPPLKN